VGADHGERGARAYNNGGLGAEPPAGSRGRSPGHGVRGTKPVAILGPGRGQAPSFMATHDFLQR